MSEMFETLKFKYSMQFVTKENLKQRVVLYAKKPEKGITAEEYELITGEVYEA